MLWSWGWLFSHQGLLLSLLWWWCSLCERCLVRGGESFRELDFIWDALSLSLVGWQIVVEWTTMNDAMFIGKANGLWGPMFDDFFLAVDSVYSLAWKCLRNSIALVLQFPWMSKVLTQDQALCEFTSISFWQFVYGHIQFFPCVLVGEHFLFKKNKFHGECPFLFVNFFYAIM